jgi:DNA-binding beta-propeller fold protein YncE
MGIPPEGKFYDAFLEEASGLLLVVSSWSDPALYLVNTRTHKVLPLPAPGGYAGALEMTAYDPVTRTVDVTSNCALWQPRPCPDVYTVSFAERRITQMTDIPEANRVAGILRSGEDEFLTDDGGSRILHVSGKDKKVVGEASWPASNEVWKMALDPSKGLLYTSSSYFGWKLSEVDVRTHRIARERWIGPVNTDVAFQEGYIYAARPMAGMVDVYDQRTFERVRRLPTLFGTREIDLRGDVLAAGSFFQARGVLVNVRTGKTEINVKLGGPVRGVQRVGDKSAIFCSRCGVLKVTAPGT